MRRLIRKMLSFLMTALLISGLNGGLAFAAEEYSFGMKEKADILSDMLTDLMIRISEQYLQEVSVEELYEGAVNGMMDTLDEYSQYFTEEELDYFLQDITAQVFGIGVYLITGDDGSVIIEHVIRGEPAEAAGMADGDIILSVDHTDVTGMDTTQVSALIKERNSDRVMLEVSRAGEIITFEIQKAQISKETAVSEQFEERLEFARNMDNSKYGYIIIDQISENTPNEIELLIHQFQERGVTGVVFDFRGNPGGQLDATIKICNLLVPAGPVLYTIDRDGKKITYSSELEAPPFEKMVVLADKNTASAAEIIIAAMQDAEVAVVVGEKTYGKGVVQTLQSLLLGDAIKLTTMEYYRRSGVKVNGVGVKPNVLCRTPDFLSYEDERMHNNGSTNELHKAKEILSYLGYETGEFNHINDELTAETIKAFQESVGLKQTGFCDYETQIALNSELRLALVRDDMALLEGYRILLGE